MQMAIVKSQTGPFMCQKEFFIRIRRISIKVLTAFPTH